MLVLEKFQTYVAQHQLFNANEHILLAVSGGKDSVLMVKLFELAGYRFSIAHCNFNLRPDEAQRDELFVKLLAGELEVPFHVAHFDTLKFAKSEGLSTQMAARKLRYEWFEELRGTHQYKYIALAHHQNDSIETILINLVRGTGISGMHGILPKRDYLIRPLLFLSRQEIDDFVAHHEIVYVEDSSNQSTNYARNKIRLNVIPHLQEINPNLAETFAQNIDRFTQTEQVLKQVVAQSRLAIFRADADSFYVSVSEVTNLHPQQLLWFELLRPFNFTAAVSDEILNALTKQTGTSFYSHTHRLTIDRAQLIISPIDKEKIRITYIPGEGTVKVGGEQSVSLVLTNHIDFSGKQEMAYVDADLLIFPLVLRSKADGDRFMPLGMRSFKKLSDFFIDNKIAAPQKKHIPILINGNGEVIWVAGLRQDERYKVRAETKKVAIFELLTQ